MPEGFGCIGRLDKDTTGLLMFTNDGDLGHVITKKGNRYLTGHVPYSLQIPLKAKDRSLMAAHNQRLNSSQVRPPPPKGAAMLAAGPQDVQDLVPVGVHLGGHP